MNTLHEIAAVIKTAESAVIFTHMRPDGDTVGSALALSRALSYLGIKNEVLSEGKIPETFACLKATQNIRRAPSFDAQMYICVDSSDPSRLGLLESVYNAGARKKITVNVDHHISNTRYAKYNFVRERSANCENMTELIELLGVPLDKELACELMAGLITDSGNFTHSDVKGDCFRIAAKLADAGADVNANGYELFRKRTKPRAELYAETVSRLRYLHDNRLVVAIVPQETLSRYALDSDATDGIVDFGLNVDTAEVSVCLLEVKKEQYKVSLRSKGRVNVNEVARTFGGGGHVLASGCMLFGALEEVLDRLSYAVLQHLG
ncbi:MAG: bifunctional oligoribonuclease/PAP phosphatase NrnA [Clostridiales bacterium]|nr:bifunctional oligoribonuclease/PAP phosphatase NrnA [Clostridiales bacterium]